MVFLMEKVWKLVKIETEKILKNKMGQIKKIVFSGPLEKYVLNKKNCVCDMYFAETKFFYKNYVLDLNLKNEYMSNK